MLARYLQPLLHAMMMRLHLELLRLLEVVLSAHVYAWRGLVISLSSAATSLRSNMDLHVGGRGQSFLCKPCQADVRLPDPGLWICVSAATGCWLWEPAPVGVVCLALVGKSLTCAGTAGTAHLS